MFIEDRKDHLQRVILPALREGTTVVCDRYVYSSVAYQGAAGANPKEVLRLNCSFAPHADITFLIEISVERALLRIRKGRNNVLTLFEDQRKLERVAEIYRDIDDPRVVKVEGDLPAEIIHEQIVVALGRISC